jgi:Asp-tRNA(Asn)/Glu-tRNA(Gln) amidotransferase A subunit family amidase
MAAGVRAGELSAAELVADALSAAAALDPTLHFVDLLTPDSALEVAARIDGLLADPATGWLPLAALDRGQLTDPSQLTHAHEVRRHNDHELAVLFGELDVLVTPTTPQTAFPLGEHEANLSAGDLCWAFNLSGHPAVTVPAGLIDGLPVGLQAVAAPHRDDLAVELAGLAAVSLPDPL